MSDAEKIAQTNGNAIATVGREEILAFEKVLAQQEGAVFGDNDMMPLKHSFAPGVYVREIFIPKGSTLTGKIHRHAHPNFLMKGEVIVVTEFGGREHLKAPMSMISKAGTKRAIYAVEDTVWITVHVTDETDLAKIEEYVIAPSYEALASGVSELETKNCLILALKELGRDYKCLLSLDAKGTLLPLRASIEALKKNNIPLHGIDCVVNEAGDFHAYVCDPSFDGLKLFESIDESVMVGAWVAVAIGGGALVGAGASYLASDAQSSAAQNASNAQLHATLESIKAQKELTQQGFNIFQQQSNAALNYLKQQNALALKELQPLKKLSLANLKTAQGFTDPNSKEAIAERAAYQKVLANNLSARGLTASGTEIAGLSDFELGLARERRNISLALAGAGANTLQGIAGLQSQLGQAQAGVASNLGQTGAGLFSGLGANVGQSLQQGGAAQAGFTLAGGQAAAQGIAGVGNAFQGGLGGIAQLYAQQQQQQQQNAFLTQLLGKG